MGSEQRFRQPLIIDIKGNSLDDGPGIRSVVFFKGCPLTCAWCQNPESKTMQAELLFDNERCVQSLDCVKACPEAAITFDSDISVDREKCTLCFDCVDECPSKALSRVGTEMCVEEVIDKVTPYTPFFDNSGGGVTLSGGEPTLFMEFTSTLLRGFKEVGIHTLIETCCWFDYERFEALVLPFVDTIYADIKIIDSEEHKRWCGVDNGKILDSFLRLHQKSQTSSFELLPRTPLIPEITDTDANIHSVADFYRDNGVKTAAILKNNPIWFDKCEKLGAEPSFSDNSPAHEFCAQEKVDLIKEIFADKGVDVTEL